MSDLTQDRLIETESQQDFGLKNIGWKPHCSYVYIVAMIINSPSSSSSSGTLELPAQIVPASPSRLQVPPTEAEASSGLRSLQELQNLIYPPAPQVFGPAVSMEAPILELGNLSHTEARHHAVQVQVLQEPLARGHMPRVRSERELQVEVNFAEDKLVELTAKFGSLRCNQCCMGLAGAGFGLMGGTLGYFALLIRNTEEYLQLPEAAQSMISISLIGGSTALGAACFYKLYRCNSEYDEIVRQLAKVQNILVDDICQLLTRFPQNPARENYMQILITLCDQAHPYACLRRAQLLLDSHFADSQFPDLRSRSVPILKFCRIAQRLKEPEYKASIERIRNQIASRV